MRRAELGTGMQSRFKSTASGTSSVMQYLSAIKGQAADDGQIASTLPGS
jgi:hypothetical protein